MLLYISRNLVGARCDYFVGNLMFSIFNSKEPHNKDFEFSKNVVTYDTRAVNDLLSVPFCRTEFYKHLLNIMQLYWNSSISYTQCLLEDI